MKYELTEDTKIVDGHTLHRIRFRETFRSVRLGEMGGYVESLKNIADEALVTGDAMVYGQAKVTGNAQVTGQARVLGNAIVCGRAIVCGEAVVCSNARIYGLAMVTENAHIGGMAMIRCKARVYGNAHIGGCARIGGAARISGTVSIDGMADIAGKAIVNKTEDFIVFKNWWSTGHYITWTRSDNMWKVGDFHGTANALIELADTESEKDSQNYRELVRYVENEAKLQ